MTCLYCGGTEKLGKEHLVPRARGGLDIPENLFRACQRCNASKGNKLPSEWRKNLPSEIYELERKALLLHPALLPLKNTETMKRKIFNVKCTAQQKKKLEDIAAREGLGLSSWVLHAALLKAEERQAAKKETR